MEIRRRPPNPTVRVENLEYAVPHREAQAKNILEEIVWHKDIEIKNFKKIVSLEDLIKKIEKLPTPKDFYKNRGINLIKTGNKWSFRTAEDLSDELTIFKTQKRKLSRAALETLSIIAYQQPITRSEIENIRGVQMGRGSLDHLMEIGWIRPSGRKSIPGKPTLWSTTDLFVEHFGLNSLSDLPNKEELKASGFLDKRAAIATISDLAKNDENLQSNDNLEQDDENNIDDFIQNT